MRLRGHSVRLKMGFEERLKERTRIARDLHDTLLQTIQGSKLIADVAEQNSSDSAKTKSSLKTLSEWLGRAALEGRIALESLRATEASDLETALRLVVEDYNSSSGMKSSLSVEGPGREMDPVIRDEVYWIAYEAIRNAYSHSQASQVKVEIAIVENLMLRIKDDGRGIPDHTLLKGKTGHFGLKGMRERAFHIGATLTISSSAQLGTDVGLVVPGKFIFRTSRKAGRNPLSVWKKLWSVPGRRGRDFFDGSGSNRS
jgi:signal transduction histidine kinase